MKRRTISLLFGLLVVVLNLNVPVYSSDVETTTNDYNKMMEEVNEAMSKYNRAGAYDLLLVMEETLTADVDRLLYMEMLSKMMIIEEYYWLIAPLTNHTIELYEVATESEQYDYIMQTKYVLSYIEYSNYENRASLETLNELLAIEFKYPNSLYKVKYLYGLALLAYDDSDYIRSRSYIDEALEIIYSHPESHEIFWYDGANLLNIKGYGYEYEGEFELAMECHQEAYGFVPTEDIESSIVYQLPMVDLLMYLGEYEKAESFIVSMQEISAQTSSMFSHIISADRLNKIEAELAYMSGDYEKAADLYYEISLFDYNDGLESFEDTLESSDALYDFEENAITEQFDVYKQLQETQSKAITNLMIGLTVAVVLILIIIVSLVVLARSRKKLHRISITDQLTNLSNRRHLMDVYDAINTTEYCIALIDLDHFKQINDEYGHLFGDKVLARVAEVIKSQLRSEDFIGRYGGEEFMLIIRTSSIMDAASILNRILKKVADIQWDIEGLQTTVSIGLVYSSRIYGDKLIKVADEQLYLSKAEGRNRISATTI